MFPHNLHLPNDGSISPQSWYKTACTQPDFSHDAAQAAAIKELDELWHQLMDFKARRNQFLGRSLLSPNVPKGLYMWGGVGRGKTFLMDVFYASLPYRRKRRIHLHNFMVEVHHKMKLLTHENDPLVALAQHISDSTRLLCLDEFHIEDIADAMILGRLITELLKRGVVLITTSNYPPENLYLHGLQRQNFLPAIDLIKRELKVLHVDGGNDYRTQAMAREPLFLVPADAVNEAQLETLFERFAIGIPQQGGCIDIRGKLLPVKKLARNVAWFNFKDLCGGAHAQEDYLTIARRFPTLFLSNIPKMTIEYAAEMRRFTWLIDVLYDHKVMLIASAAAMPEHLDAEDITAGEFSRTASRLYEMQSQRYLRLPHRTQSVSLNE